MISCMTTMLIFSAEKKGENPMSQEYIEQMRIKRLNLGVSQLSKSGMAVSDDTMNFCIKEKANK